MCGPISVPSGRVFTVAYWRGNKYWRMKILKDDGLDDLLLKMVISGVDVLDDRYRLRDGPKGAPQNRQKMRDRARKRLLVLFP